MPDSFQNRLDAAQKAYDRSAGALEALQDQRDSALSRLLEAHGVTSFESLQEKQTSLEADVAQAEHDVEEAFKEAKI